MLSGIQGQATIDFLQLEPEVPFPFPWTPDQFFDAMPETVKQEPRVLKPLPEAAFSAAYDLVIFGYQPWFLHPSQPTTAFLQSSDARILNGKKVITVIGCRNMWLNSQELVKQHLQRLGATLCGNIVLHDTNPNTVSVRAINRWMFEGKKEADNKLPESGVQERDIQAAKRFGPAILQCAAIPGDSPGTQTELVKLGAVDLDQGLILLEKRGVYNFRKWAGYIRAKGEPGNPARLGKVRLFQKLLYIAIDILSPITNALGALKSHLRRKELEREKAYYQSLRVEEGKF